MMDESKLLYVASPYSHVNPAIREHRYRTACRASALLMKSNIVVFSPLSHSVSIAKIGDICDMEHAFWMSMDLPVLRRCDELLILGLEDWERSLGIQYEMFEALSRKMPITLIDEADIDLLPKVRKTAKRFLKSKILTEVHDD
jgi:hypothetical protein